ncbi:hypothetical protein [Actinophytocola oryzae]|uniref:Uncharacterized protein n=1 Tax=Actinophytocola oryzae TaxID=502181 RepID=A0A4R7W5G9_9PSEU|nr:hypothetical protein [Actinophytocola oryzae]TDV57822.1 hypothetical protein CLV71_101695 [Actinophytocola oryzae]
MSIWGISLLSAAVVLAAVLLVKRGDRETRAARKELRRLRNAEKRQPNTYGAAEQRRNMYMEPMPGNRSLPGGP